MALPLPTSYVEGDPDPAGALNQTNTEINAVGVRVTNAETQLASLASNYQGPIKYIATASDLPASSTADASASINAFIAATPAGSTVVFDANRTYGISSPIKFLPNRRYTSSGYAMGGTPAKIKALNGSNINNTAGAGFTGLMVPNAWDANATGGTDGPALIDNLDFDGNKANNTGNACGVVVLNYWSRVVDCHFENTVLDAIRLTDRTKNGNVLAIAQGSENRIQRNKIENPGGCGIRQTAANNNVNLDGFMTENLISGVGQSAIQMDRSPGWSIKDNHIYGVQQHGIVAGQTYATTIAGNYIETFGAAGGSGNHWKGITMTQLAGSISSVTDNKVGCTHEAGNASSYRFYEINASSGAAATVVFSENATISVSGGTNAYGLYMLTNGGGGTLNVVGGNSNAIKGHAAGKGVYTTDVAVTHDIDAYVTGVSHVNEYHPFDVRKWFPSNAGTNGTECTTELAALLTALQATNSDGQKLQQASTGAYQRGNAAPGGAWGIHVTGGMYTIGNLPNDINCHRATFFADSWGSGFIRKANTSGTWFETERDGTRHVSLIQFRGMTLHGDSANQTAAGNCFVSNGNTTFDYTNPLDEDFDVHNYVINCQIIDFLGHAIVLNGSGGCRIQGNHIRNIRQVGGAGGVGIWSAGVGSDPGGFDNHLDFNDIGWTDYQSIVMKGDSTAINGGKYWYSGRALSGGALTGPGGEAILCEADGGSISGIRTQDTRGPGVYFKDANNISAGVLNIDSASMDSAGSHAGIRVENSDNCTIIPFNTFNRFNGPDSLLDGLQIDAASENCVIIGAHSKSPWGGVNNLKSGSAIAASTYVQINKTVHT